MDWMFFVHHTIKRNVANGELHMSVPQFSVFFVLCVINDVSISNTGIEIYKIQIINI